MCLFVCLFVCLFYFGVEDDDDDEAILSKLNFLKNVTFHLHLNTVWQKFEFDNLKIDFRP